MEGLEGLVYSFYPFKEVGHVVMAVLMSWYQEVVSKMILQRYWIGAVICSGGGIINILIRVINGVWVVMEPVRLQRKR